MPVAVSPRATLLGSTLVLSEMAVERHRSNVFDKLGLHDRVALTRWATRRGLVEP